MTYIKERIIELAKNKGISVEDFAINIGMTYSSFKGSAKYTPLNSDAIGNILTLHSDVNPEWLLTGKGEMLKENLIEKGIIDIDDQQMSIHRLRADYYNQNRQIIPLFEIEASAGLSTLFANQSTQIPLDFISVPNAPKCDGALFVRGDSMYPLLKAGDIACYKTIVELQDIRYGEMYLLDIEDNSDRYLTVKYVHRSDLGDDYITLVSENKYHAPKDEHKSHIKAIALIKVTIRYNTIS